MTEAPRGNRVLVYVLAYLVAIHALLFCFDLGHPRIFLTADRASQRIEAINGFVAGLQHGAPFTDLVLNNTTDQGVPGDFMVQALAFAAGGRPLVILVQIALLLVSVVALYRLSRMLGISPARSAAAVLLYAHLPDTLYFPHALAAEAIFDPLVIIGCYFSARLILLGRTASGVAAAVSYGVANLVRPLLLPWGLACAVMFFFCRVRVRAIGLYLVVFAILIVAWPVFVGTVTGTYANDAHGIFRQKTIYAVSFRLQTLIERVPEAQRRQAEHSYLNGASVASSPVEVSQSFASVGQVVSNYVAFSAAHPMVAVAATAADLGVFLFKSDIERVTIDYLDLAPEARAGLQSSTAGWRREMSQDGMINTAIKILSANPGVILASLAGALFMAQFWALAVFGVVAAWCWPPGSERRIMLGLALLPIYAFATTQVVYLPPARYRAPADFVLCLLYVLGWQAIGVLRARRARRAAAAI